jgi:phosphoglycolate phosphatase-like HAD superfamily hydrolase
MIYFLDLDGVIIDSIEECYVVSKEVYFRDKCFIYDEKIYKKIFYEYRGIVGPANEFEHLHNLIEKKIVNTSFDIQSNFKSLKLTKNSLFEKSFFSHRKKLIEKNFNEWIKLNSLTDFGRKLVQRSDLIIYIITTKNRMATKILLNHHKIFFNKIFSNEDIKKFGSKGNLIKNVVKKYNLKDVVFIDDLVDHLISAKNLGITTYFADWGYGKNTNFEPFDQNQIDL